MKRTLLFLIASVIPLIPVFFFYFRSTNETDSLPFSPCDSLINIHPYWPVDFALYDSTFLIISARSGTSESALLLLRDSGIISLYSSTSLKLGGIHIEGETLYALNH